MKAWEARLKAEQALSKKGGLAEPFMAHILGLIEKEVEAGKFELEYYATKHVLRIGTRWEVVEKTVKSKLRQIGYKVEPCSMEESSQGYGGDYSRYSVNGWKISWANASEPISSEGWNEK